MWCFSNIVSYVVLLAMRTSKRIVVNEKDRVHLGQVVRNGNTPQKVSLRARIVLLSADGVSTGDIMRRLGTSTPTISRWRNRYATDGWLVCSRTGVDRGSREGLVKPRCVR